MIREIRRFYGISQTLLGHYSGISRSMLSMAEIGKRTLSTAQTAQLLKLYLAIDSEKARMNLQKSAPASHSKIAERQQVVLKQLNRNDRKLLNAQQALARFNETAERPARILASVEALQETAEPHDEGLLKCMVIYANKLAKKTDENARLKLELKIHSLRAQGAFLAERAGLKKEDPGSI
jgi:transcriptional regulator with XRE-family HTH domain